MGKIKTEKSRKGLAATLLDGDATPAKIRAKKSNEEQRKDEDEEFIGDKLSQKILQQARAQQEELEEEFGAGAIAKKPTGKLSLGSKKSLGGKPKDESDDESDEEGLDEFADEQYYEDVVVDEDDEKAMAAFMSHEPVERRTLADIIMDKINEKKTEIQSQMSETPEAPPLDERVVKVFKSVGKILSKYRSGKLPKAFKIIPSLENWEEILYCTEPDLWTAAAHYQASRVFVSNLNAKMAQRFFNLVLLPRVRDDIAEFKRLNYHLYMALKKAMFKPAAFFKGILLPLCESRTCTLREAVIISSVIQKVSIPVLHSAACMLKIAEMDYNGANSIFLRVLLDKKYALPFRVLDALVAHFVRFQNDRRELPVLWHQALLVFIQRYKQDISMEQKDALLELIRKQNHHKISVEIRRELVHSSSRDMEDPSLAVGVSMDGEDW